MYFVNHVFPVLIVSNLESYTTIQEKECPLLCQFKTEKEIKTLSRNCETLHPHPSKVRFLL